MPPVVKFIAGVALIAASMLIPGLAHLELSLMMFGAGASLSLGGIAQMLRPKPGVPLGEANRKTTVRQQMAPGRVVYGAAQLGGVITYMETNGGVLNEYLHIVVTLAAHELASIDTMQFDGVDVPLDGNGDATGNFVGLVHVEKNLGGRDQTAFSGLVSSSDGKWTTAHRQRGRAGVYVRVKWKQDKFPGGVPNITFDVTGRKVRDPRTTTLAYSRNSALVLADYLTDSGYGLGAVRAVPIAEAMLSQSGYALSDLSKLTDGELSQGALYTNSNAPGTYVLLDLGAGNAREFIELRIFVAAGAQNTSNFTLQYSDNGSSWTDALADITLIAAPRDGLPQRFRVPYSGGARRYWRLYLTNAATGPAITEVQFLESLVDRTKLSAAADVCDEDVTLAAGGTENRYETDGAFSSSERPSDVVTALAGAMGGYAVYVGGRFLLYPGAWRAPDASLTFSEADLAAPITVKTRAGRRDSFNTVRGTFISAASKWQPTNFPTVSNPAYVAEDGGEVVYFDADLPLTISNARAQRIAKINLNRMRRQTTVTARFKLGAYRFSACDVIKLSNARFGWSEKLFEVASTQLAVDAAGGSEDPAIFVDAVLRETDSDVYAWNAATDERTPDGSSLISVTDLRTTQPVTNLAVAAVEVVNPDSSRSLSAVLSWTAPADPYVTSGGRIHVYYKLHADADYTQAFILYGSAVTAVVPGIKPGVSYDYKVVAENIANVFSSDAVLSSQVLTITTSGMLSYRPLSNPLTATDAGSNATVVVAAFTMRVQGVGDKSISAGSVSALSYGTLYFIYYDDPTIAGGSVTLAATTTKETALDGAGRFFVGSIRTPVAGAPDTVGNNDGGAGAQLGGMFHIPPTEFTLDPLGLGTEYSDPTSAMDGDYSTSASGVATVTGATNSSESWHGFQALLGNAVSLKLKIRSSGTKTGTGTYHWKLEYSTNGGGSFTTIYDVTAAPAARDDVVSLSLTTNVGSVVVRASVTAATNGNATHLVTEIFLEVQT